MQVKEKRAPKTSQSHESGSNIIQESFTQFESKDFERSLFAFDWSLRKWNVV